jgi:hypothetical protein
MIVMKFGGSSVADAERMREALIESPVRKREAPLQGTLRPWTRPLPVHLC